MGPPRRPGGAVTRAAAEADAPFPSMARRSPKREESPLHRRVRDLALERILSGELPPGARVSVSGLARETGISRTPVREALLQLLREGFLALEEHRGFFVRELTEREARELYPILHALEEVAIVAAGRPSAERLARLEELNRRLAGSRKPGEAIALNFAWHRLLTEPCGNRELAALLERYRMRVYRYEHAYYEPGRERIDYSVELHREILDALRAGDLGEARIVLRRHWLGDYSLYVPEGGRSSPAPDADPVHPMR